MALEPLGNASRVIDMTTGKLGHHNQELFRSVMLGATFIVVVRLVNVLAFVFDLADNAHFHQSPPGRYGPMLQAL
jgi:hypothetical protein